MNANFWSVKIKPIVTMQGIATRARIFEGVRQPWGSFEMWATCDGIGEFHVATTHTREQLIAEYC